ncbi:MAG: SDR family NAD(P)-dependent oxidoreductase [Steroidobacteraceae bacterium]|jgi:NAD(P)-dependent dehydrogenase (short-subunit alcohol dehydrogenase family)|nr:SDR family NAD(P)-dependent oxidoreductase [Steroidobacteraceae bacterium]
MSAARGPLARLTGRLASAVLDPTIVLSFDRSGFARHAAGFDPRDLEVDLTGRTCLVTGANSGIGYATSLGLAARGASVWMLCRDAQRAEAAARELRRATGSRRVHVQLLDISDLAAIRRFAAAFAPSKVDVLVHNAGMLADRRETTAEGHELTLATHVLGPLLLTCLLRPKLAAAGGARVVWVSSGGMYTARLSAGDAEWRERPFDGVAAYAEAKRMQVVLAEVLARQLATDRIAINAMHPGWAETPAVKSSLPRFYAVTKRILRTPAEGADTVLWLAASDAARGETGKFWFDRAARRTHFLRRTRETPSDRSAFLDLCREAVPEFRRLAPAGRSAPR